MVETYSSNFNIVVGNYQLKYCGKMIKKRTIVNSRNVKLESTQFFLINPFINR